MWDNGSHDCGLWDAGAFLDREQLTRRAWEKAGRGIRLVCLQSDCVSLGLLSQNQVLDDTLEPMTRRRRDGGHDPLGPAKEISAKEKSTIHLALVFGDPTSWFPPLLLGSGTVQGGRKVGKETLGVETCFS